MVTILSMQNIPLGHGYHSNNKCYTRGGIINTNTHGLYIPRVEYGLYIHRVEYGLYIPRVECGLYFPRVEYGLYIPRVECGLYIPRVECGLYFPRVECGLYIARVECGLYIARVECGLYKHIYYNTCTVKTAEWCTLFIHHHSVQLQWNLSTKDTLNNRHLSNEDTVCSPTT